MPFLRLHDCFCGRRLLEDVDYYGDEMWALRQLKEEVVALLVSSTTEILDAFSA